MESSLLLKELRTKEEILVRRIFSDETFADSS